MFIDGPRLAACRGMSLKVALALGLVVFPACVEAPDQLGQRDQSIVGGQTANPADYPSVVGLENAPGSWFCTGTLITPDWVLTAAHCVAGGPTTGINVRFDDPDINDAAGGTVVAVAGVHSHPMFDWDKFDNDIALLKLATPVTDRERGPAFATIGGVRLVVGVTSSGTGQLCGAGWDLHTSVFAELEFVDMVLSGKSPEPEPDPVMPEPETPDPTMPGGEEPSDDDGGCSTGGSPAGFLAIAFVLLFVRRRRATATV